MIGKLHAGLNTKIYKYCGKNVPNKETVRKAILEQMSKSKMNDFTIRYYGVICEERKLIILTIYG